MKTNVYEDIQKFGEQRLPISQYLAMVRRIAIHLRPRVPAYIELDDMIQLGIMGLIEAEKNFDPSQGVSFEIFAKAHTDAIQSLSNNLGRLPTHREVADVLGLTIEAYENQRNHANQLNTVELESFADESGFDADHKHQDVFDEVADENVNAVIDSAISTLDERRQLILKMYYVEEMNLKEIGAVIGVNESRVSQILSATLKDLRPLLEASYRGGELA